MAKKSLTLGEKIGRDRDVRADTLERAIGHHAGSVWAINAKDDVRAIRAAAERARSGDLTPFRLA